MQDLTPSIRRLTTQEFRDVIGRFASGVTIITAREGYRPVGTTASAVSSLSLEPPMILICMDKTSATGAAVRDAGHFAVNILGEDHADLARRFATKARDKFDGVPVLEGDHGVPLLEGALATLECRVSEETSGGTHWVFLAEVERASARAGAPLAYYRGKFGRLDVSGDGGTGSIEDALRARAAIESGAAALTVGRLTAAELAECRRLVAAARPVAADGTPAEIDAWIAAQDAFLEHMVALAGSEELLDAYRRIDVPARFARLREAAPAVRHPPSDADQTHLDLLAAHEAGNLPAALEAIQRFADTALGVARALSGGR